LINRFCQGKIKMSGFHAATSISFLRRFCR
jgi:hypothetical protein